MSLSKVLEIARGELGNKEDPAGSNRVKYWEVMPSWNGQPWCVVFLLWCFRKAEEAQAIFGGAFTASCSTLLAWYRSQGQTVPVSDVQPGDIVLLNFHAGNAPEHCGLVEEVGPVFSDPYWPTRIARITTIEGNTSSDGSQSNGGQVCRKVRYSDQIVAVCRPQYKPEKTDDITGHWAEDSIRKAMAKRVVNGYDDGSFQPDKPTTRAELVTILDRLGLLE